MVKDDFSLLQLGSHFHSFAIIPFGNNYILFTKLIPETWEHGDAAINKSDAGIQMVIQVLNKRTG